MTALRLAALFLCLSAPAASAQIFGDNWSYLRDEDPLNEEGPSTRAVSEQADELHPIQIDIACVAFEGLQARVTFPEYIAEGAADVRYRVDDGELVKESWTVDEEDRSTLLAPEPAMFAWRLTTGRRLYIEAQKDRGDPVRVTFETGQSDNEVYRVMKDCRVYRGGGPGAAAAGQ